MPTGGMKTPIPIATHSTMPYCSGSMPNLIATGSRIGAAIKIAGRPSSTRPITIITNMLTNRNAVGLLSAPNAMAKVRPRPSVTIACDSRFDAAIMNRIIPAIRVASRSATQQLFHPIVW